MTYVEKSRCAGCAPTGPKSAHWFGDPSTLRDARKADPKVRSALPKRGGCAGGRTERRFGFSPGRPIFGFRVYLGIGKRREIAGSNTEKHLQFQLVSPF